MKSRSRENIERNHPDRTQVLDNGIAHDRLKKKNPSSFVLKNGELRFYLN